MTGLQLESVGSPGLYILTVKQPESGSKTCQHHIRETSTRFSCLSHKLPPLRQPVGGSIVLIQVIFRKSGGPLAGSAGEDQEDAPFLERSSHRTTSTPNLKSKGKEAGRSIETDLNGQIHSEKLEQQSINNQQTIQEIKVSSLAVEMNVLYAVVLMKNKIICFFAK
ncbi:uncharacterized protein V6R79_015168 [Siganus canaliculatus]